MTATIAVGLADAWLLRTEPSHMRTGRRQPAEFLPRRRHGLVGASISLTGRPKSGVVPVPSPVSPPGVIGGAVIRAARRSAHLTRPSLAQALEVGTSTVRAWENGTIPLFSVPHGQLQCLAVVLSQAGAHVGHDLSELLLASQCDLLITGLLHGFEDYAEVPPIEERGAEADRARELLRWALAGPVPNRYRRYASPQPLLDRGDLDHFVAAARDLQAGSQGQDLAGYGSALVALTSH